MGTVDYSHIGALTVHLGIECVPPAIDAINNLLPQPMKVVASKMGDRFIGAVTIELVDAFNLQISHADCPFYQITTARSIESLIFEEGLLESYLLMTRLAGLRSL